MKKVSVVTGLGLLSLLMGPALHGAQAQGGPPRDGDGPRFEDRGGPPRDDDGRPPRGPRGPRSAQRGLGGLFHAIGDLGESGSPLSKTQAKRVVTLIKPWSTRPTMSEADAKKLDGQLKAILTAGQLKSVGNMRPPRGPGQGPVQGRGPGRGGERPSPPPECGPDGGPDRGGPGGDRGFRGRGPGGPDDGGPGGGGPEGRRPGDDGPGGQRGPGGDPARRGAMREFHESMNPFYAPTGYKQWKDLPEFVQKDMVHQYNEGRAILEGLSHKANSQ